jgi:hypothetical protein
MFVMKLKFDWGVYTYNSFLLDSKDELGVTDDKPYLGDLIKAMLKVFNVDYLSSIREREVYILFEDRDPCGFVNIHDTQNFLIFKDFFKVYDK